MNRFIWLLLIVFTSILNSAEYEETKIKVDDVKVTIQKEEEIVKAFEQYLLDNYKLVNFYTLKNDENYLGSKFDEINPMRIRHKPLNTAGRLNIPTVIEKADDDRKKIYANNNLRTRTLFTKLPTKVERLYIIIKDKFANYLYTLMRNVTTYDLNCDKTTAFDVCICKTDDCFGASPNKWGMKDNLYFFQESKTSENQTIDNLLFYFHKDNFESGPAIVNSSFLADGKMEEYSKKYLKDGITLFDRDGKEYVKTPKNGIKQLGDSK